MSYQSRPPPGQHRSGGPLAVQVQTNCFEITRVPTKSYYQYSVVIVPDVPIIRKRHEIIHKLQTQVAPATFSPRALYDGKAIMYVSHELRLGAGGTGRVTVSLRSDGSVNPGQAGVFEVQLTRTIGEPIKPADLQTLRQKSSGPLSPKIITATNLLQLLIRQAAHQVHPHHKAAYFTAEERRRLSDGLELWKGFFQSVRPTVNKLLINIDMTMSAVYQSGPLMDVAMSFLRIQDARGLMLNEDDVKFRRLERFLKNVRINTTTAPTKVKTIKGLISQAGYFSFQNDGRLTTVEEYYHSTYNIKLRFPKAVGVRLTGAHVTTPVVIPAELCTVIAGQLYRKKLPNHLTADAVKFSAVKPVERLQTILSNRQSPVQGYDSSEFVLESGMQISKTPLTVSGKLLNPPPVLFGQNTPVNPSKGSWNVVGKQLAEPKELKWWTVVTFSSRFRNEDIERFVGSLMTCCQKLGMRVQPPSGIKAGSGHNVAQVIQTAAEEAATRGQFHPSQIQLVLVILPEKAEEIRNHVKHVGDVRLGIATQCVREDKLRKWNDQYCNNVAIKINMRLGGTNFFAGSSILQNLSKVPYMIMGADVSHPGPGSLKPSIASLVASEDDKATKYVAYVRVQHPREEIIVDLKEMVKTAIINFGSNKPPPSRIIFYRDGVSDGEFEKVGRDEIPAIKAAIDSVWSEKKVPAPKPTVTFIIVGKRHHITFFPQRDSKANDGSGNCLPGFVTDEGQLANPLVPDFYLQSHSAIQGTSRSGHFIVLLDQNFNNDYATIQTLSYDLCHVYAKATRSVSIPAPVYYADLACARGAFHIDPASALQLGGDDSSSTTSGNTFDLEAWQRAFKFVNKSTAQRMYFL